MKISSLNIKGNTEGFIAVTAVIMTACSTLLFTSVIMQAVVTYSDMINRKEWRTQANLNAESCLSSVKLMVVKDYFLTGEVSVSEFGCTAVITRNYNQDSSLKSISIKTTARFNSVTSTKSPEGDLVP